MSEISLFELLVRPLRLARQDVADEYEILLTHFPNLVMTAVSRRILLRAASVRAEYGFRAPDAIILATGIVERATMMITNDMRWKCVKDIAVLCLNDLR
jgi:predicted nucleic acid-binding protein